MKQKIIIATMLSWIIALAWCSLIPQTENWQNETPNPASVFCEENGGTLEIIPDEWGTRWKGNTIEIQEIQELQDDENLSQETKEEISELVEEIQEHDSQDIDATVDDTLKKYESTWSDLQESDIELMNEIIDIVTQN